MKQILLITDGCSNVGISPVVAAAHALSEGIAVNVVGVIDQGEFGEFGTSEITEIAKAGGGMSRIVSTKQLSQTVQMLTRITVAHTIEQAVNKQLQNILGGGTIQSLPPEERSRVVQVMDDLGESAELQIALLIDASASMKPKLASVEEAIRDLILSLQSRQGSSRISVFHFPGEASRDAEVEMDIDWTNEVQHMKKIFNRLTMRGTTPTGPALFKVVDFFLDTKGTISKGGMLSDYVV